MPRKICLRKEGAFHSLSRASSATLRASSALTAWELALPWNWKFYNSRAPMRAAVYSFPRA